MKLPSQTFCLVVASAALVLAGCTKKPARPDPSATLGPIGSGTASSALNPMDIATTTPDAGLMERTPFDANGEDRTSLQSQTVYFDFDSSAIKASERTKLQAAKDYLEKNPGRKILVEGRCDWRGTAEYNLALGDRRANAAKKYLQSIGVPADRIEVRSKGSLEAAKNADDATMAKDRRDDLIVLQGAGAPGALPAAGAPADLSTAPAPHAGGAL